MFLDVLTLGFSGFSDCFFEGNFQHITQKTRDGGEKPFSMEEREEREEEREEKFVEKYNKI